MISLSLLDRVLPWRWRRRAYYRWQMECARVLARDLALLPVRIYRKSDSEN